MATSLALYPMEYIVLNLFVLPEHAVKSVTLVIGIKESEINIPKSYFGKKHKGDIHKSKLGMLRQLVCFVHHACQPEQKFWEILF